MVQQINSGDKKAIVWGDPTLTLTGSLFDDGLGTIVYYFNGSTIQSWKSGRSINSLTSLSQWQGYQISAGSNLSIPDTAIGFGTAPSGTGGGGTPELIKVPFAFNSTSPLTVYTAPANTTVFTCQVVIQTAFNGTGTTLKVGDATVTDRLMLTTLNNPNSVGEYESNPSYTYSAQTPIILTIGAGTGVTQGSGYVLLEV